MYYFITGFRRPVPRARVPNSRDFLSPFLALACLHISRPYETESRYDLILQAILGTRSLLGVRTFCPGTQKDHPEFSGGGTEGEGA